jgi:hypothetical protein
MSSVTKIAHFGGEGGRPFPMSPITGRIGLRSQHLVDQIAINGKQYWKNNGVGRGEILLANDEYISKVEIRDGEYIDYLKFTTNKGQSIEGGDPHGGRGHKPLENIRVLAIGGRADASVDRLDILYVSDYKPSAVVEPNATFILEFAAPGTQITEYVTQEQRKAESFERASELQQSIRVDASVEAEYYVKAVVSTGMELKSNYRETYRKDLESKKTSGTETKFTMDTDHVGVKLVSGNLMKGSDGNYWMHPTGPTTFLNLKMGEVKNLLGTFDLTQKLYRQMSGLEIYHKKKHGFDYYNENPV